MKPVLLSTKRLILRRADVNDPENLFRNYFSDSSSSRFLTRKPHNNIDQSKKFLHEWCDLPWDAENEKFSWIIALSNTNEGIGVVLVELEDEHIAQIHFGISPKFANQGLVTEAVGKVVQWLMTQKHMRKVWAICDLSNHGSRRVLEKLGFQNAGILKDRLKLPAFGNSARDCYFYTYAR